MVRIELTRTFDIEVTPECLDCRTMAIYSSFLPGFDTIRNAVEKARKRKILFPEAILTPSQRFSFLDELEKISSSNDSSIEVITMCPIIWSLDRKCIEKYTREEARDILSKNAKAGLEVAISYFFR